MTTQRERAEAFHALHRPGEILVLPNAWDAASARVFALAGFPAVATTSAGLAWSHGYPDGERLPRDMLLRAVERIVGAAGIPVSVDLERGFGRSVAEVRETVGALLETGAVGINLEDGPGDGPGRLAEVQVLVEKVAALRELADGARVPLFINARTDLYLLGGDPGACFEDAVRRLAAYADAGADGLFVPGLADLAEIARLVRAVSRPLNVYAAAGVPPIEELARVGVARVSVGCGPMQATLALVRRIADELRDSGTYTAFVEHALPYGEANSMFGPQASAMPSFRMRR